MLAIGAFAQTPTKVFVAPMEGDFDTFITAAIMERKVPVVITTDEAAADFVIVGTAKKGDNKWSDTIFGTEKDRNQGSIKVFNPKDKTIVFAASAGDKTVWFGAFRKGGQKKVAERLADQLKDYFKNKK